MKVLSNQKFWPPFFLFYLCLIILSAWHSIGWLQADEHARVMEPTHQLVFGYASLPWELRGDEPIVSYLLAVIHYPALKLASVFGLDATSQAFVMRAFSGLVNSTRLLAWFLLTKSFGISVKTTLFFAFCAFQPFLIVRTSQENWSSTALMWALVSAILSVKNKKSMLWPFLIGFFIALATAFRFQVGFSAACLGVCWVVTYLSLGKRPREHAPPSGEREPWIAVLGVSFLGLLVGLLPMAIVDAIYAKYPFQPAWNYLWYGIEHEGSGTIWGHSPWWFYIEHYLTTFYPPFSLLLWLPLAYGMAKSRWLLAILLPFCIVHQVLPHKEIRYFSPVFPIMCLSVFYGWSLLAKRCSIRIRALVDRVQKPVFLFIAFVSLVLAFVAQNPSPALFVEIGKRLHEGQDVVYVANSLSGMPQFYIKSPDKAPRQVSLKNLLGSIDNHRDQAASRDQHVTSNEKVLTVIYRVQLKELKEVQTVCSLEKVSVAPWMLHLMSLHPRIPPKKRVDATLYCPENLIERAIILEKS